MSYLYSSKKTVICLASKLDVSVACNVVAHLSLAIGHHCEANDMGNNPLVDKSGIEHMGISKFPIILTKVKQSRLKRLLSELREEEHDLLIADYPTEMLSTGHDEELKNAISNKENEAIEYYGVALHGDQDAIDRLTGKFTLYG